MCREEGLTRDPERCPSHITKERGISSDLGEIVCGTWWKLKPDFLWVEKPVEVRRWRWL